MDDRIDRMAGRVAFYVLAKERPDDMFGAAFFNLREKAKALKEKWSQEAGRKLQDMLTKDLTDRGYKVESVTVSLGKYKGSRFVTSAKVIVTTTEAKARELAKHLLRYSPKYAMKSFDPATGVAEYNIR
jgi:hypothetical protein